MTGIYSHEEHCSIASRFAEQLTDGQLRDISIAILRTCEVAAAAGHCSPHWIDLNAIGVQLGLIALEQEKDTKV